MDEETLQDIKRCLIDALKMKTGIVWKKPLIIINDIDGTYDEESLDDDHWVNVRNNSNTINISHISDGCAGAILSLSVQSMNLGLYKHYDHTSNILDRMRDLDERQMFESDDEVGVIFQDISDLVNSLGENLENETIEDNKTGDS